MNNSPLINNYLLAECIFYGKQHKNQKVHILDMPKNHPIRGWLVPVLSTNSHNTLSSGIKNVVISEKEAMSIISLLDKKGIVNNIRTGTQKEEVVCDLSDEQLHKSAQNIAKRFRLLERMASGANLGHINSLIVSGTTGVGKSYTVVNSLLKQGLIEDVDFVLIKGHITPINLYITFYNYRAPGNVIVLDDSDSILFDEIGLNLLKNALDTEISRRISWASDALERKELDIPKSFIFEGSVIFLSNINFQKIVDEGKSKIAPHLSALMSRSLYLDLNVWSRVDMYAWVDHLLKNGEKVIGNLKEDEVSDIMNFVKENLYNFRTFSVREMKKVSSLYLSDREYWKDHCRTLLFK